MRGINNSTQLDILSFRLRECTSAVLVIIFRDEPNKVITQLSGWLKCRKAYFPLGGIFGRRFSPLGLPQKTPRRVCGSPTNSPTCHLGTPPHPSCNDRFRLCCCQSFRPRSVFLLSFLIMPLCFSLLTTP